MLLTELGKVSVVTRIWKEKIVFKPKSILRPSTLFKCLPAVPDRDASILAGRDSGMIASADGVGKSEQFRELGDADSLRDHVILVDRRFVEAAARITDVIFKSKMVEPCS